MPDRLRWAAAPEHQTGGFELRQRGLQLRLRQPRYHGHQLVIELPAGGRADLRNLTRGRKAVEPSQ